MKVRFFEHTYFSNLSDEPVLIDLGACTGEFTKHFLETYPKGKSLRIEPLHRNFAVIPANNERSQQILGAVVGKPTKYVTFFEDRGSTQGGSATVNYFNGTVHQVKGYTIAELFAGYEKIDLVKVDIEGAEWDMIDHADSEDLLKANQYTIEFHDFLDPSYIQRTEKCIKKLVSLGYKYESIGTAWMHGSPYYDMIFYK